MLTSHNAFDITTAGPEYLGWRGELLAELALSRVPGLTVFKELKGRAHDFAASTSDGFSFFVDVRAFSSMRMGLADPACAAALRWPAEAALVRRAARSTSPVVLFLFDADTDHGRFLRLDTLPAPPAGTRPVLLTFPAGNTIDRPSVERLVDALRTARHRRGKPAARR